MHVVSIGDVDGDGENEWSVNEDATISLWRIVGSTVINVWVYEHGAFPPVAEIGDVDNDTRPLHVSPIFQ